MAKIPCAEINGPVLNKTNALAALMVLLGAVSDPQFSSILPDVYAPKILYFSGLLLIIIRAFLTGSPVKQDPNKPAG